jgi:hypothetical protein
MTLIGEIFDQIYTNIPSTTHDQNLHPLLSSSRPKRKGNTPSEERGIPFS